MTKRRRRARGCGGHAIVEASLMLPWIIFLFVGVLDFGFYSYAAICTQNAARVAAMATVSGTGDCDIRNLVVGEMKSLPNMGSVKTCTDVGTDAGSLSQDYPISVTTTPTTVAGPDGKSHPAVQVSVTYLSMRMIPIPGVLMGQMTMTRTVEVPNLNTAG